VLDAATVVKAPVVAELAPIVVPSIAPALISTVAKVDVPEELILFNLDVQDEFIEVKVPAAADPAPITVPSIFPPSQSIVPLTSNVPPTVKVLPEPTLRPTLVPVPLATKIPSTASKSVFILPPQVDVLAPTSGLVKFKLVVNVSAIIVNYILFFCPIKNILFYFIVFYWICIFKRYA
jgi:hypothetical protein